MSGDYDWKQLAVYARFTGPRNDPYYDFRTLHSTPRERLMEEKFKIYRRKNLAEIRPYVPGEDMTGISVAAVDSASGSPKDGDMVARNPENHNDQWLVAKKYFEDSFELDL